MNKIPSSMCTSAAQPDLWRLFVLRNVAIAGQTAVLLVVAFVLQMTLPVPALGAILASLALFNLFAWWRGRAATPHRNEFLLQLLLDIAAFTALLYFIGGATDPFVYLLLIPLTMAATALTRRQVWIVAAAVIGCYSLLMVYYVPLPSAARMGHSFQLHVFGMWVGFVLSAGLIAHFVAGMAHTLRRRERELFAVREQTLRDEKLVDLAALATGAAHELGTPLSTMAVLVNDMKHETGTADERLSLLDEQIRRCKQALGTISTSAGEARAEAGRAIGLERYLDEVLVRWRQGRPQATYKYRCLAGTTGLRIVADQTLTQALTNLLHNAADTGTDEITVETGWDQGVLAFDVSDRGTGISPEIARQLGEQPVTTRPEGHGLGLYLSKGTIERLGGQLKLAGRAGGGTVARVRLPLNGLLAEPA